jgi:phosphocarrier protein
LQWQKPAVPFSLFGQQSMSAQKVNAAEFLIKELTILNQSGLHARPAAMFVKTANRFGCEIFVEKDGEKINGKSIMGLMMLAAGPGSKVTLYLRGADAAAASAELTALVNRKFGEE